MKFSVCIESVCRGRNVTEALSLVQASGFNAFEFWNWRNKDIPLIAREMKRLELSLATFCTDGGTLVDPDAHKDFLQGIKESVSVAARLGCDTLITQTGNEMRGISRERQIENVVTGLRLAAPIAEESGVTLLLEPLNTVVDHPGYLLTRSSEAFDIIEQVGSTHVKVLFDIYHQQITEGNLISAMLSKLPSIGHFHAAGCPGRHELQFGEIHYGNVIQALRSAGYSNYFGLEFFPSDEPTLGLEYARRLMDEGT
jgi:hydroxypyruvate isomerase